VKSHSTGRTRPDGRSKNTMITTSEVASIFNVHPGTIRRWCEQNKLRSYRTGAGGRRRFKKEDIAVAYLEKSIRNYLKVLMGRA
jgi:excisionase family DNA binding protein